MPPLLLAAPWIAFPLLVPLLLRKRPRLRDFQPAAGAQPLVSIIVPARNEAINIGPCLATLQNSCYQNKEIIVVDDGSTDATGDVARAFAERTSAALRVVETAPLPSGWIGKSWACWTGYQEARGELLLFTDADTRHDQDLLALAVGALDQSGVSLLTLLPRQIMESFWERVVLPHVFLGISLRFASVSHINRTRNPRQVLANGQFLLMPRASYERMDGHQAVRHDVVEDVALAQHVIVSGERLLLLHAPDYIETRMYRSLPEIIEGWSKNLALGMRRTVPALLAPVIIWFSVLLGLLLWVVPPTVLLGSLFLGELAPYRVWALYASAASLAGWLYVNLSMRSGITAAVLFPIGSLLTCFLMARSALRGSRVVWRGRTYDVPAI
ncbi:MAG: glycosyltransferase [Pseudomonas sp.]